MLMVVKDAANAATKGEKGKIVAKCSDSQKYFNVLNLFKAH